MSNIIVPGVSISQDAKFKAQIPINASAAETVLGKVSWWPPMLSSFLIGSEGERSLVVNIALTLNRKHQLTTEDIEFRYVIGFDSLGGDLSDTCNNRLYKLMIYCNFPNDVNIGEGYHVHWIQFSFSGSVGNPGGDISVEKFKKVQSIVVSQNPETSRGTETVVQDDDD
jgi:hypothetical protein